MPVVFLRSNPSSFCGGGENQHNRGGKNTFTNPSKHGGWPKRTWWGLIGICLLALLCGTHPDRKPHDIIVEEGLPPNPGPAGLWNDDEDLSGKRRKLTDAPEEDDGITPTSKELHGITKRAKGTGEQGEIGTGKKHKAKKSDQNAENYFRTGGKKLKGKAREHSENNFAKIQINNFWNRDWAWAGRRERETSEWPKPPPTNQQTKTTTNARAQPPEPSRQSPAARAPS